MAKLRLGPIADEKPVKLAVELPAAVHRDLLAYAEMLGVETGQTVEAARLIAPMLARFMAADRAFSKARRIPRATLSVSPPPVQPAPSSTSAPGSENA